MKSIREVAEAEASGKMALASEEIRRSAAGRGAPPSPGGRISVVPPRVPSR